MSQSVRVHRLPKTKGTGVHFCSVTNHLAQDPGLSFAAKGIMLYVLSMPTDWRHSAESLSLSTTRDRRDPRKRGAGTDAIRVILAELKAAGYAKFIKYRDEYGQFRAGWEFYEVPLPLTGTPNAASPDSEGSGTGKPECGDPAPFESTVDEKTVNEKTRETESRPHTELVRFPWPTIDSLPDELRNALEAGFPDPDGRSDAFADIAGAKLDFGDLRYMEEWRPVFLSAVRRRAKGQKAISAVPPVPSEPEDWQRFMDEEMTGSAHCTGGNEFGPWSKKPPCVREFICREMKRAGWI